MVPLRSGRHHPVRCPQEEGLLNILHAGPGSEARAQIRDLIPRLRAFADRPFEDARAMPAGVYTSEGMLAAEREEIFKKEWICAGRQDALAAPGDYVSFQIGEVPLFVVRGRDGGLRAFSNVCLHRMSTLLSGQGNCKTIVCPYHAWTYGLDGKLRNAPYMDNAAAFDKGDYRLPEFPCEAWEGWIYVTLNRQARPLAETLRPLYADVVGRYRLEDYVETFREEHVWNTNWKILAENFMESYHLFRLHAATIGPHSKVSEMECPPGGEAYNYHWITKKESLGVGTAHPDNRHLEGRWRHTTALITVYPSHLITLTPGYFWYLSLRPEAVDRVQILYGGGFAPDYAADPGFETLQRETKALLDETNAEDRRGVEAVLRGMRSDFARPGHLNPLERPNYEFGRYIVKKVLQDHEGAAARGPQCDDVR
jgi:phenylpropionate dioxygenase-like ring-hydroxylating dioxygenase large terminal subunit